MAEQRVFYFNFFYQRILTSCTGWKDDEFGAFVKLLIHQFDKGYIPDDEEELSRIITSFKKNWPRLSKKFKPGLNSGELINQFMEEVREKALKKIEKNGENGKLGGRPKKNQTVMDSETESKPNGFENKSHPIGSFVSSSAVKEGGMGETQTRQPIVQAMADHWKTLKPDYPYSETEDFHALFEIGQFLAEQTKSGWLPETDVGYAALLQAWEKLSGWAIADDFYKSFSLAYMAKTKTLQTIWQKSKEVKNGTAIGKNNTGSGKSAGANELADRFAAKLAARGATNPGG